MGAAVLTLAVAGVQILVVQMEVVENGGMVAAVVGAQEGAVGQGVAWNLEVVEAPTSVVGEVAERS